ncbi:hypothetical protein CEXT_128111 [Caerostris extrusa]|uniref:Uncharacterized protein n=1 Tax=Caerostris extrusa TaxID=172846 RepID=A0AAV4P3M9_CAEEX|nr:hypothetical protein CEXT_128111 [Caerostris extrusa]
MSGNDGFHAWGVCPETFRKMEYTDPGWENLSRSGGGEGRSREGARKGGGLKIAVAVAVGVLNPHAEPPLLAEEFVGFTGT